MANNGNLMNSSRLTRRGFLARSLKLAGIMAAGGFGYSLLRFVSVRDVSNNPNLSASVNPDQDNAALNPAAKRPLNLSPTSIEIGAATIPQGESRMVAIGNTPVIVVHGEPGFRAFVAVCSHLGCLVKWDNGAKKFVCPCHSGTYDAEGQVLSGPPPAGLRKCRMERKGYALKISLG